MGSDTTTADYPPFVSDTPRPASAPPPGLDWIDFVKQPPAKVWPEPEYLVWVCSTPESGYLVLAHWTGTTFYSHNGHLRFVTHYAAVQGPVVKKLPLECCLHRGRYIAHHCADCPKYQQVPTPDLFTSTLPDDAQTIQ